MSERPPNDPQRLIDFPSIPVDDELIMYRIHRLDRDPAYFSARGDGRFDPPPNTRNDYGACYLATSPIGAFLETLGRVRPLPESLVNGKVLSQVTFNMDYFQGARLADLTDRSVIGRFGISGDLSTGADYAIPQLWSAALLAAGFAGIRYFARHDPALVEISIALFGPPGERRGSLKSVKGGDPEPIDDGLLHELQEHYGIVVAPTVPLN